MMKINRFCKYNEFFQVVPFIFIAKRIVLALFIEWSAISSNADFCTICVYYTLVFLPVLEFYRKYKKLKQKNTSLNIGGTIWLQNILYDFVILTLCLFNIDYFYLWNKMKVKTYKMKNIVGVIMSLKLY